MESLLLTIKDGFDWRANMDIYRAIEVLEYTKGFDDVKGTASSVAIDMAIKALEKQIPMKVEIKPWSPARCPACGYALSESQGDGYYNHPTFLERCPIVDCNQRLEW